MASNLEIEGTLSQLLDEQTGTNANTGNAWRKGGFILETMDGQFPRKIHVELWGEKLEDIKKYKIGQAIKASINIESREYMNKWYTGVKAWKLEPAAAGGGSDAPAPSSVPMPSASHEPAPNFNTTAQDDDLPF